MSRILTILVASFTLASVQGSTAGPLADLLGNGTQSRCWSRSYDAAHLAANPAQKVARIRLDSALRRVKAPGIAGDVASAETDGFNALHHVSVDIVLREGSEKGTQALYCRWAANLGGAICGVESDGGSVILRTAGGGRLQLSVNGRFQFETDKRFVDLARSDDKEFLLSPLPPTRCGRSPV